ncbi:hypothetical protein ARMGADRAFT_1081109 [Armillaria gallica]|uniref:Uncharacterized protein n=1 Tax=Armillaria gallica TaxID=47427 RepID=A0A2H3DDX5_ARMGA|nr:hypothetical protein ARMGADRAFT_1081109 [Armillaria gallica]
MAKPLVVKDPTMLRHEALSSYEAAAALLQHKVDFPPDGDSSSKDVDEWISEVYIQWTICSNFWKPAGVKKMTWNDAEYALLECLPLMDKALIDDSRESFNTLVHRAVHQLLLLPDIAFITHSPLFLAQIFNSQSLSDSSGYAVSLS